MRAVAITFENNWQHFLAFDEICKFGWGRGPILSMKENLLLLKYYFKATCNTRFRLLPHLEGYRF